MKKALLERFDIEKDRLFFEVNVMGRLFSTSIWYKNVDFHYLKDTVGKAELERIVAHIAAFEMNKYGSLHIDEVNLGELNKYVDEPFAELWSDIFIHVWAQWRFENNLPYDKPPRLVINAKRPHTPHPLTRKSHKSLTFFGGGKDSFVSTHLLQESGLTFDVLEYSSSIYGNRAEQSDVEELAHNSAPLSLINQLAVYDDFLDSPILEYDSKEYKIHTLAAAETPASVFECLPIVMQHGYQALALGHEKSANYPNLLWDREENNPINHQWGKSLEAQKKIASYIKTQLITDTNYYSTLMPLSDPAIFSIFSVLPWDLIKQAHSCNVTKPWCRRCAKCVYVWLFYLAFLDADKVTNEIFKGEVLFDIEDNYNILRMLVGLESQTPFECVGQPPESRLALALCFKKGFNQSIVQELMKFINQDELEDTLSIQFLVDADFLEQCELPQKLKKYYQHDISHLLERKKAELLRLIR